MLIVVSSHYLLCYFSSITLLTAWLSTVETVVFVHAPSERKAAMPRLDEVAMAGAEILGRYN